MKLLVYIAFFLAATTARGQQGICGRVVWTAGNQMPGPDGTAGGESQPIQREVFIYEATRPADVSQVNGFYTRITTRLAAKTMTRKDGTFRVKLPAGTYSVFVREPDGLWANLFDGSGTINPVIVANGEFVTVTVNINYMAAY